MHSGNLDVIAHELRRLTSKTNELQGGSLVERLMRATKLDAASVRIHLKEFRDRGWIQASSWSATDNPIGRITISLPPPPEAVWCEPWRATLTNCSDLTDEDRNAIFDCGAVLSDMDSKELPKIINGLIRLRSNQHLLGRTPEFIVSARNLLGSSKMLGKLGARALRAFGIDLSLFPGHPLYVVTAGPSNPQAVMLVENPAAFELATRTAVVERCALIVTFGFGLSKASEDYGNQLATMVENGLSGSITLMREGSSAPPARELLKHENITFWGDLDIAGIQIYERIAKHIPSLQLSALYRPMIDAVTEGENRHPYVTAVGKSGQTMFAASREDSKAMLRHCSKWAVDQEFVTESQIDALAGEAIG